MMEPKGIACNALVATCEGAVSIAIILMVNWLINSCDVGSHLRIYITDMALTKLSTEWRFCPPKGEEIR